MEEVDQGCPMIRMGVSEWMFLLVPAYPGSPTSKGVKRLCVYVCVCYFLWPRTLNSTGTISMIVSHDRILRKKSYIKSIIHDKMAWLRKTKLSKLSACVFTGSDEEWFSEFLLKQHKARTLLLLIIIILIIKISTRVLSVYGSRKPLYKNSLSLDNTELDKLYKKLQLPVIIIIESFNCILL